jgi:Cd2+/Zn2+-exporting ATPase
MGVEGRIDGALWQLLAPSRVATLDAAMQARVAALEQQGKTVVVLGQPDAAPAALLALRDQIHGRKRLRRCKLNQLGLQSIMLTGDNPARRGGRRR